MSDPSRYVIHLEPKFDAMQRIDIPALVEECEDEWYNQTLCQINDAYVRLGILKGEFHWHKHDQEDEFFFVLEGELSIDFEDQVVVLSKHQGYAVPKGVVHRTRAPERAVVLMVEPSTVAPTGDAAV